MLAFATVLLHRADYLDRLVDAVIAASSVGVRCLHSERSVCKERMKKGKTNLDDRPISGSEK